MLGPKSFGCATRPRFLKVDVQPRVHSLLEPRGTGADRAPLSAESPQASSPLDACANSTRDRSTGTTLGRGWVPPSRTRHRQSLFAGAADLGRSPKHRGLACQLRRGTRHAALRLLACASVVRLGLWTRFQSSRATTRASLQARVPPPRRSDGGSLNGEPDLQRWLVPSACSSVSSEPQRV